MDKGPNGFNKWDVSQAEFKGFVKAKLEDNEKIFDRYNNKLDCIDKKISRLNKSVAILQTKAVMLSAGIALFISSIITIIIINVGGIK